MAIDLQKNTPKKDAPWFPIVMVVLVSAFMGLFSYFIFIKQPPLIERLQPTIDPARRLEILQQFAINPKPVLEDYVYLEIYNTRSFLEEARNSLRPLYKGRQNPFTPFSTSTLLSDSE